MVLVVVVSLFVYIVVKVWVLVKKVPVVRTPGNGREGMHNRQNKAYWA